VVDAAVLVREYLLTQSNVTALLGTNINGSIYCAYDLPEHFKPELGPAIQIFRAGGHSHEEITPLLDARIQIKAWSDQERYSVASALYAAINDALHGACGLTVTDGTIIRALEVDGPIEMTDPDTGWVTMYAFYTVMARPNGSSVPYVPQFYSGAGAPGALHNEDDIYSNSTTGDVYEQVSGSWVFMGNIPIGGAVEMPSLTDHVVSVASTNAKNIKSSAGVVTGWKIYNNSGSAIFLKLFNKATIPIPGTDTPQQTIGVDAGESDVITSAGYTYTVGIGRAITKNIDDLDNTPVALKDCSVDVFYQ
jgi:hypothetical protein